jgi:O-antigen ligase
MNQAYSDVNGIMNGRYISSWGYRWNMNRVSQAVVSDHPFFGAGLGGAKRVFIEKSKQFDQTEGFERWNNVHNGYMQILIETGFVGLFLFIYFIYRLWRSQMVKNDLLIISSVIVVYLIGFIGEPLFFNKVVYLLFNLFVGLSLFKSIHFSEKTL